jgi:hypothetical protein
VSDDPPYAGSALSALFAVTAILRVEIGFPVAAADAIRDTAVSEALLVAGLEDVQPTRRANAKVKPEAASTFRDLIPTLLE